MLLIGQKLSFLDHICPFRNTPPLIDHVITDGLPYNADKDPENPMSHEDLFKWVAKECEEAAADLDERKSPSDKDGAVKVTKGFAWAVQGKALLFVKDYAGAKAVLKKEKSYELTT